MAKKRKKRGPELALLQPDAAGMDIGASEIFVAVPADRDDKPVRSFPTFTRDLNQLADWLKAWSIRTVAMESTSVYWIPNLPDSGRTRFGCVSGQCAVRQECPGTEE